ncbi:hypothetical protein EVAR_23379_1 [Eumeta japonica]|uniref:Reverse transcriptase domain-containing protein n=1 Tax=Eumeta variegata TaxID=151549 RepID=A0A4C1VVE7_EUMVA|nr:hypothetical protein EVAR_23379_1 [Eumeta japonica]
MKKLQTADISNKHYQTYRGLPERSQNLQSLQKPPTAMRNRYHTESPSVLFWCSVIFNLHVHDVWDHRDRIRGLKLSQHADDLCTLNRSPNPNCTTCRAGWAVDTIINYYRRWGLKCNADETECAMYIHKRNYCRTIRIRDEVIEYKNNIKYFGVHLEQDYDHRQTGGLCSPEGATTSGALASVVGWHAKADLTGRLAVVQAYLHPILVYSVVQLLSRYSKTNLLKTQRQYRIALKTTGRFPRRLDTTQLWEMLDWDP